MHVSSSRGKMLGHLRRDCWGCDNRICGQHHPCSCTSRKAERARERRQLERDVRDELGCDHLTHRCHGGPGCHQTDRYAP